MRARELIAWGMAMALLGCGSEPGGARPERTTASEPERRDVIVDAAWSPDGLRLVVTWDRGAGARLYGLLAGSAEEPPAPARGLPVSDGSGAWATWSPDGLWVAYESAGQIVRVRPDGTGSELLTDDPAPDGEPAYSPDGSRLLFVSERGGAPGFWVMDADGSDARPLPLSVAGDVGGVAWDPAGGRFAFHAETAGVSAVYLGTLEGGIGRVTEGARPAWSPDGARIFFERSDTIFSVPAEGGTRRVEVPDARAPALSPDGRRLAFVRGGDTTSALYLRNLQDSTEIRITPQLPR